jgi:hypothetical protein
MKYFIIFLVLIGFVGFVYAQSENYSPSGRDYVPYTENKNVEFTDGGKINYDSLIAKIMPEIFEKKFHDMGINVSKEDIVLERGFSILIYEPHSYNCGFAVNHDKTKAYWLEAAINSTHIQYADIYEEIPRDDPLMSFYGDCFALIETKAAEIFLEEKSFFTEYDEKRAAASVKHYLRGNDNLNKYQITVGKFNYDFGNTGNLSICGEFIDRNIGSKYYLAVLDTAGTLHFSLEKSLSPLCAINDNSTLHDIKFQNTPKDKSLQSWKNLRAETVYLKPNSIGKLLERNYMDTENVHNLNLEYATSLEMGFIDFIPDNSNTVFTFEPTVNDTFVKIRVPQNGANYFMNYGPNEWNAGDLTDVTISIDGNPVKYNQFEFVRAPDAPYPQYFTDYVFEVPAGSSTINVHLEIENYELDDDHDEWSGYTP